MKWIFFSNGRILLVMTFLFVCIFLEATPSSGQEAVLVGSEGPSGMPGNKPGLSACKANALHIVLLFQFTSDDIYCIKE